MKKFFIGLHKSMTVWFGYFLIALPQIQANWADIVGIIPEKFRPYLYSAVGLAVILLRVKTTQSVMEKAK